MRLVYCVKKKNDQARGKRERAEKLLGDECDNVKAYKKTEIKESDRTTECGKRVENK